MGESRRKTAPERPEKHLVKKEETERITGADGSIITEATIGELNYKTIEMNSHSELEIKLEKHKKKSLGTINKSFTQKKLRNNWIQSQKHWKLKPLKVALSTIRELMKKKKM